MTINYDYVHLDHVTLGELKIHYAYAGKPQAGEEKPLLLCLHGFPEFNRVWHHQLQTLSNDFYVVAPDLRGYNLSDKPQGINNYRVTELLNDATDLVESLGYKSFNLVGHDWGGLVAWTLATLHPEVIDNLIIINSPHPRVYQRLLGSSRHQILASQYISKFRLDTAEEKLSRNNFDLLWRFGFKELVEKGVFGEKDKEAHLKAWSHEGAIESMLAYYRVGSFSVPNPDACLPIEFELNDTLANIVSNRTFVIWGMEDTALSSECLTGLDEYVKDLRILEVPGAGHGIIHERPELISEQIKTFIKA